MERSLEHARHARKSKRAQLERAEELYARQLEQLAIAATGFSTTQEPALFPKARARGFRILGEDARKRGLFLSP